MPKLQKPSIAFQASFLQALEEYRNEGENDELDPSALEDPRKFKAYVKFLEKCEFSRPPHAGLVYWWCEDDTFIGRFLIRHHPHDPLRITEGSMGYSVRPSFRRQGQGRALLLAGLEKARERHVEPTLAIEEGNQASLNLARSAGFRLSGTQGGVHYFQPSLPSLRVP